MVYLYQQLISRPILNALVFFYQTIAFHDLGLAIIFVTLFIRLILYPFFHTGAKQQMLMQRIQPKIKKIQEKHKDNREEQAKALMELYKEHGVNPFASILLLIVQLPILIGLYRLFLVGIGADQLKMLYSFIPAPAVVNSTLLGLVDLKAKSFILVLLAAIAQFFQARLAIYRAPGAGEPSQTEKMAQNMAFVGPLITILIFYNLPAAVGLYWFVSSIFSVFQQILVNRHLQKKFGE